jgi:hypothetical protein
LVQKKKMVGQWQRNWPFKVEMKNADEFSNPHPLVENPGFTTGVYD